MYFAQRIYPAAGLFFLFTVVTSQVWAGCDLADSRVTLKTRDTAIEDILQQIEKQTSYDIQADNPSFLQNKKTIFLKDIPLNRALRRLLKDINYSVLCNEKEKTLRLVLLDKKQFSAGRSTEVRRSSVKTDAAEEGAMIMAALDAAEEDYNSGTRAKMPEKVPHHPMMDLDAAEEDYNSGHRAVMPKKVPHHPMMDLDAAEIDYQEGHRASMPENVPQHPMMALDAAEADYLKKKENGTL